MQIKHNLYKYEKRQIWRLHHIYECSHIAEITWSFSPVSQRNMIIDIYLFSPRICLGGLFLECSYVSTIFKAYLKS